MSSAAATAVNGATHATIGERNHERDTAGGAVRAIAASIDWHRAQLAACASTAARSLRLNVSSAHRATVSASRQPDDLPDIPACSVSRSSRPGTSLINDLLQIERTGIVGDRCEARVDLTPRQPGLVAQLALHIVANRAARARKLARGRRFAFLQQTARFRERELLHVVTAEPQPIAIG